MVEKRSKEIETIEKRPDEEIGPEESKRLNRNKNKDEKR